MEPLDRLEPNERAVLDLILTQGFSYEDLTGILGVDLETVRERARRACERLAPEGVPEPPEERRAELVDYLLGRREPGMPEAPHAALRGDDVGTVWAQAVSERLLPLSQSPAELVARPTGEEPPPWEEDIDAAESQAHPAPGRAPDLAIPFAIYMFLIVAGIASYVVVGLTHH